MIRKLCFACAVQNVLARQPGQMVYMKKWAIAYGGSRLKVPAAYRASTPSKEQALYFPVKKVLLYYLTNLFYKKRCIKFRVNSNSKKFPSISHTTYSAIAILLAMFSIDTDRSNVNICILNTK